MISYCVLIFAALLSIIQFLNLLSVNHDTFQSSVLFVLGLILFYSVRGYYQSFFSNLCQVIKLFVRTCGMFPFYIKDRHCQQSQK